MMRSSLLGIAALIAGTAAFGQTPAPAPAPITFYQVIIQKPGCNTLIFPSDPAPPLSVNAGQPFEAQVGNDKCSGIVDHVEYNFLLRHYPTVDVRTFAMTIILK